MQHSQLWASVLRVLRFQDLARALCCACWYKILYQQQQKHKHSERQ